MQQLPLKYFYCQNEIACRFLNSPSKGDPLIITIPGGPCLSSKYLDNFLIQLGQQIDINVGIVDLPNHGDSTLAPSKLPLSYTSCLEFIKLLINEIAEQCDNLILFGQSFGARLAFDLLSITEVKILGVFLTGFPYIFQVSEEMQKKIESLDLKPEQNVINLEESFMRDWSKILSLYSFSPLPCEAFDALTSNTKIQGNELILKDVPAIEVIAEDLLRKKVLPYIGILQGDSDGVVPDKNISKLKSIVPYASFFEIEKCGHFPMLENPAETIRLFSQFYSSLLGNR